MIISTLRRVNSSKNLNDNGYLRRDDEHNGRSVIYDAFGDADCLIYGVYGCCHIDNRKGWIA